jgi:mycofactocin precursor
MTSTVTESVVSQTTDDTDVVDDAAQLPYDDEVLAELLIEEISIDGMCGVY